MEHIRLYGDSLTLITHGVSIAGWRTNVDIAGVRCDPEKVSFQSIGNGGEFTAEFQNGSLVLILRLEVALHGTTTVSCATTVANRGADPVSLGKIYPFVTSEVLLPADLSQTLLLPQPGVISPRMVYRILDENCPEDSYVKSLLYDRETGVGMLLGFDSFGRCDTRIGCCPSSTEGYLAVSAYCDFGGWELPANEETLLEHFTLEIGPNPYELLENWADRAENACIPPPRQWSAVPIGWLGWSWVDAFNVENYEETLLRNCQAIRERLPGHDLQYIWLSIGNLADGNPGEWLDWNYTHFPSGPHELVRRLEEMGFLLGLWCGPFYICSSLDDLVSELEAEGALLQKDGDNMVVCARWRHGKSATLPEDKRPAIYALDPSHPRSCEFIRNVFATYREWGVRYYMIDFLNAGSGSIGPHVYDSLHDPSLVPGPEAYRSFLNVIREACGDDTYLLSSSGPTLHNAGIVDAVRTGSDFGEGRQIAPASFSYPASYVINHGGFWTGPLYALRNQACSYYTHRRLFINDSGNVLTVDSPLPLEDARVHAAIHLFGGSPSMIGDDVGRMADDRLELIRKTLPRPVDVAFPVDLFDTPSPDHPRLFHRRISAPWGEFDIVAVFNLGSGPLTQSITWEKLGIPEGNRLVWEFWNQEYVGTFADGFEADIPARTVRIFRLTPDTGVPCVLGTDMHMTMGEMELTDVILDPAFAKLSGTASRPGPERGHLFLHAPRGMAVRDPEGFWIAKDGRDDTLIIKVALDFTAGDEQWSISFVSIED